MTSVEPLFMPAIYDMNEPNQEIIIYEDKVFIIRSENAEIEIAGTLSYTWHPRIGVKLTGTCITSDAAEILRKSQREFQLQVDGFNVCNLNISKVTYNRTVDIVAIGYDSTVLGDQSITASKFKFVIPNFRDFDGDYWIEDQRNSWQGRIVLDNKFFKCTLDQRHRYSHLENDLKESGGFLFLYNGEIEVKGKTGFNQEECRKHLQVFDTYLTFMNGRRTGCMFIQALNEENDQLWLDLTSPTLDSYKPVSSWTLMNKSPILTEIFPAFTRKWQNENDQDFLNSCIHWYVEANGQAGLEDGSIIFAQTALELIFNYLIVEKMKIIREPRNIKSADKLRLILNTLNVKFDVPDLFQELWQFVNEKKDSADVADVIVNLRNSLVHQDIKKSGYYKSTSELVKRQTLQVAIKYIELAILYVLDYRGTFFDRTARSGAKQVPWAKTVA